ncbi:MAG: PEP/pyruvate-binding domain-containing protein [Chitinophagales bacterium]
MAEHEDILYYWPDAFQAGPSKLGGKGWNLSRLDRYGFNIPAGGVLSAKVYQSFIEENGLKEAIDILSQTLTSETMDSERAGTSLLDLRNRIRNAPISPFVLCELFSALNRLGILEKPLAIRSSATLEDTAQTSFAGVHDSFLNVRGKEAIITSIKGCYASLWTSKAVAYRIKMGICHDKIIPAVVIMEMVNAVSAGVAFTCDPITGREDIIVINANFGLGESVVSGNVEPDEYRLDSAPQIKEKRIGSKKGVTTASETGGTEFLEADGLANRQTLSDTEISRLGGLVRRVYDALSNHEQHQDIEWTYDGKDFIIVQARPLTALPNYTFAALKNQPVIWSNANLRDALPMVQSTLNWSFSQTLPEGFDYELFGMKSPPGLRNIKLFQGRAYFNLSIQQWVFFDAFGITPKQINETLGGYQPEINVDVKNPYRGIAGLKRLRRILKLATIGRQAKKNAPQSFSEVDRFAENFFKESLGKLSDHDLIAKFDAIRSAIENFTPVLFACNFAADMNPLVKILNKYFPEQGAALANNLMIGRGEITSAEQGYRLVELAEIARNDDSARRFIARKNNYLLWESELPEESPFKQAFKEFLMEFGHRGVYEMDIINPRWREDPSYLLNNIADTLETADLNLIKDRQRQMAENVWHEIRDKVSPSRIKTIEKSLEQAVEGMKLREAAKSELVKLYGVMRHFAQEAGRRLEASGILKEFSDVFHCTWNELNSLLQNDWNGQGFENLVSDRKIKRKEWEDISPPDYYIDEMPHVTELSMGNPGNTLVGIGVSAGKASGRARLLNHPFEGRRLQAGEVLVAHSTDPGWTPLFLKASAIVVETGGLGSHGSIVAREYGIPSVANIPGVMHTIEDGQHLVVDGNTGKVYIQ